jgi:hypothetical protein
MAKVLIIGRSNDFSSECARLLRRNGHRVAENNDVFEALREAAMDGVDLILWDAPVNDPTRARKFAAIKRYHRFTPLIILDDDREPYLDQFDEWTMLMNDNSAAEEVVDDILQRVPKVVASNLIFDNDDFEYTEQN